MIGVPKKNVDTTDSQNSVMTFLWVYLSVGALALILIYIAAEYFQTARLAQFISFQANDGPGPLRKNLYPNTFGSHFFGDFLIPFRLAQQSSPYFAPGILPFSYFPLASVILGPFVLFNYWQALTLFLATGLFGFVYVCKRGLNHLDPKTRRTITALVLLSGPMFSTLDRGNLSLVLVLLCLAGVLYLRHERTYLSAILFGFAGAIKGYPILFLIVYIRRREWRQFAVGSLTFLGAVFLPLAFYDRGLFVNATEMLSQFAGSSTPIHAVKIRGYNSSLLAFFDTCRTSFGSHFSSLFSFLVDNYTIVGAILMMIFLIFATSKCATDFESLLLITVSMCLLPQTVGFYVLLLYFVPMLFHWADAKNVTSSEKTITAAIAILMVPKGLPLWQPFGYWSPAAATFTSFLNPLLGLTIAFICIIRIVHRRLQSFTRINQPGDSQLDGQHTIDTSS